MIRPPIPLDGPPPSATRLDGGGGGGGGGQVVDRCFAPNILQRGRPPAEVSPCFFFGMLSFFLPLVRSLTRAVLQVCVVGVVSLPKPMPARGGGGKEEEEAAYR